MCAVMSWLMIAISVYLWYLSQGEIDAYFLNCWNKSNNTEFSEISEIYSIVWRKSHNFIKKNFTCAFVVLVPFSNNNLK